MTVARLPVCVTIGSKAMNIGSVIIVCYGLAFQIPSTLQGVLLHVVWEELFQVPLFVYSSY